MSNPVATWSVHQQSNVWIIAYCRLSPPKKGRDTSISLRRWLLDMVPSFRASNCSLTGDTIDSEIIPMARVWKVWDWRHFFRWNKRTWNDFGIKDLPPPQKKKHSFSFSWLLIFQETPEIMELLRVDLKSEKPYINPIPWPIVSCKFSFSCLKLLQQPSNLHKKA